MRLPSIYTDARYFQVFFQFLLLCYGIVFLHWQTNWQHYATSIIGCLVFQYVGDSIKAGSFLSLLVFRQWGLSVLISALSLCLLLKTNSWQISLLAAFITVAGKFIFQYNKQHFFNPSALGIVATILFTGKAWLSPAQWGSGAVLFFGTLSLGFIVVTKVQKLDVSIAFLLTFCSLLFWRQVYVLGWPMDHFWQSISTGGLLLFTFFMISDPRTAPNHSLARIAWAVLIAIIAFYMAAYKWMNSTPVWVLVATAPIVPLLNYLFKAKSFQWKSLSAKPSSTFFNFLNRIK
jgi:Na+-transporting NADH:ubiquinone oxidoreductase subunit NqrB